MTWTTEEEVEAISYALRLGSESKELEDEITAENVKQMARECGVRKFNVKDDFGGNLDPGDFPYEGDVILEEYNENK